MSMNLKLGAVAAVLLCAGPAMAAGNNNPAPAGPVVLNLDGGPIPSAYQQYTVDFVASAGLTDLSFAIREDPAYIFLDDISLTHGSDATNLVVNGGFEDGPVGDNAPSGWTYLNTFGAYANGVVASGSSAHSGSNYYYDGAVQAYDAITQQIATTAGDTYHLSFYLFDNSGATTFSAVSTNGDVTDAGGNGINLVVYAGQGRPILPGVPEPASWALMLLGFGGLGATLRARRRGARALA